MTVPDQFEARLNALEDRFGVGPTDLVIAVPGFTREIGHAKLVEWPEGLSKEDICHTYERPGTDPDEPLVVEGVCIPIHRPPEYHGGIVMLQYPEIAQIFASMSEEVRERELEARLDAGEPIPPILQR